MSGRMVVSGAALALLVGCVADQSLPTASEVRAPLFATVARAGESHLRTHLAGAHEVFTPANPGDPTPADSRAQGRAQSVRTCRCSTPCGPASRTSTRTPTMAWRRPTRGQVTSRAVRFGGSWPRGGRTEVSLVSGAGRCSRHPASGTRDLQ